jgi:oxygen-independent coproporphyrinogen III oxidase
LRPRHLYIHVPFCARRCAYCDFSIAVRTRVPVGDYLAALRGELALRYPAGEPWALDTLYLGGGTPSRLGPDGVAGVLAAVREHAVFAPGAEVTIEANPDDVSDAAAAAWLAAGVNRVSLGIQSFDDDALRWMRRAHDAHGAVEAVAALRRAGIENFSVDLIFSLPTQLRRSWRDDLDRTIALAPPHLSLYGLTIEPATPLGRWHQRGEVAEAPEEGYESEFLLAHDLMIRAGYEHYEVSNFARPGRRSRHNSSYWTGAPYAGIGPSAHEFDGRERRWNVAPYTEWARRLQRGTDPLDGAELLTEENRDAERVYLGLRTSDGLAATVGETTRAAAWVEQGWAELSEGRLRLTPHGWLRLDSLAADLTVSPSRS